MLFRSSLLVLVAVACSAACGRPGETYSRAGSVWRRKRRREFVRVWRCHGSHDRHDQRRVRECRGHRLRAGQRADCGGVSVRQCDWSQHGRSWSRSYAENQVYVIAANGGVAEATGQCRAWNGGIAQNTISAVADQGGYTSVQGRAYADGYARP